MYYEDIFDNKYYYIKHFKNLIIIYQKKIIQIC